MKLYYIITTKFFVFASFVEIKKKFLHENKKIVIKFNQGNLV